MEGGVSGSKRGASTSGQTNPQFLALLPGPHCLRVYKQVYGAQRVMMQSHCCLKMDFFYVPKLNCNTQIVPWINKIKFLIQNNCHYSFQNVSFKQLICVEIEPQCAHCVRLNECLV